MLCQNRSKWRFLSISLLNGGKLHLDTENQPQLEPKTRSAAQHHQNHYLLIQ